MVTGIIYSVFCITVFFGIYYKWYQSKLGHLRKQYRGEQEPTWEECIGASLAISAILAVIGGICLLLTEEYTDPRGITWRPIEPSVLFGFATPIIATSLIAAYRPEIKALGSAVKSKLLKPKPNLDTAKLLREAEEIMDM